VSLQRSPVAGLAGVPFGTELLESASAILAEGSAVSPSPHSWTRWTVVVQVEDGSVQKTLLAYGLFVLDIMIAYKEA
jgi:hypothetical protein